MGYTTDFEGAFQLDRRLAPEHHAYLVKFAGTRRVRRDVAKTLLLADPVRLAADLPVGVDGEFFVNGLGFGGQDRTKDILDYNEPPGTQPCVWCQWVPNEQGTAIQWDGGEKFYDYVLWIEYLIDNFMVLWGYKLNGRVTWEGQERNDIGEILVVDNTVTVNKPAVAPSHSA